MRTPPQVSVVVLTYDSMRFLDDCFGALRRASEGSAFRVLAVDNASRDGTPAAIRQRFPEVEVIENATNLGFAGGNNVGIRRALAEGAEWVYLLNHDADVSPGFLEEALAVAAAHPDAGAVQSLLLLADEPGLINSAGNSIHFSGIGFCDRFREPAELAPEPVEIAYASGAAVLYRADALREVGLFDEKLFLYHEDLDLGWSLRLAGWRSLLAPRSVVHHHYAFSRNKQKFYLMERNRWLVLAKHLSARSLLTMAPLLAVAEAGIAASAVRGGWAGEKARAAAEFLRPSTWAYLAGERRRLRRLRRRSDAEVASVFRGDIQFEGMTGPTFERVVNPLMRGAWSIGRRWLGK